MSGGTGSINKQMFVPFSDGINICGLQGLWNRQLQTHFAAFNPDFSHWASLLENI